MTEGTDWVEALEAIRRALVNERRDASNHGMKRIADIKRTQDEIDAIDRAIADETALRKVPYDISQF